MLAERPDGFRRPAAASASGQGQSRQSRDEVVADVRIALEKLPEKVRRAVYGVYAEGRTYEQVAEDTDIPLGSLKRYLAEGLKELRARFLPNRILTIVAEGDELERHAQVVPLLEGKTARDGQATAYVCENRICDLPTTDPAVFATQIGTVHPLAPPVP